MAYFEFLRLYPSYCIVITKEIYKSEGNKGNNPDYQEDHDEVVKPKFVLCQDGGNIAFQQTEKYD